MGRFVVFVAAFFACCDGLELSRRKVQGPPSVGEEQDRRKLKIVNSLGVKPDFYDRFAQEFPYLVSDLEKLASVTSSSESGRPRGVSQLMRDLFAKAFLEKTTERKHQVYMMVHRLTPAFVQLNHTYAEEELNQELEDEFLHREVMSWWNQDSQSRPVVPRGLESRGQGFMDHFKHYSDKCNLTGTFATWAKEHKHPSYGLHCGVGEGASTACVGDGARIGRDDADLKCGAKVCNDDGSDELCCQHDHTAFQATVFDNLPGIKKVNAQPCQVDKDFWDGLDKIHNSGAALDFNDGSKQPGAIEKIFVAAGMCYMFVNPCLEEVTRPRLGVNTNSARAYRFSFKFAQFGNERGCGSRPCYRQHLEDPIDYVTPVGGLKAGVEGVMKNKVKALEEKVDSDDEREEIAKRIQEKIDAKKAHSQRTRAKVKHVFKGVKETIAAKMEEQMEKKLEEMQKAAAAEEQQKEQLDKWAREHEKPAEAVPEEFMRHQEQEPQTWSGLIPQ